MKRRLNIFVVIVVIALIAGCSGGSSQNVPQPTNPNQTSQQPLATPTPAANDGVPDLTQAVAIKLPNPSDFSSFQTMLQETLYPPYVGDPQIEMAIVLDRSGSASANSSAPMNSGATSPVAVIFGVEDSYGWVGAGQPLFEIAYTDSSGVTHNISSVANSNGTLNANFIFSDTELTTWATGTIDNSGQFNGTLLYRVRQSGETQCEPFTIQCNPSYYDCTSYINNENYQAYAACINYLGQMTAVGSFSQAFSSWVTVQ